MSKSIATAVGATLFPEQAKIAAMLAEKPPVPSNAAILSAYYDLEPEQRQSRSITLERKDNRLPLAPESLQRIHARQAKEIIKDIGGFWLNLANKDVLNLILLGILTFLVMLLVAMFGAGIASALLGIGWHVGYGLAVQGVLGLRFILHLIAKRRAEGLGYGTTRPDFNYTTELNIFWVPGCHKAHVRYQDWSYARYAEGENKGERLELYPDQFPAWASGRNLIRLLRDQDRARLVELEVARELEEKD